MKNPFRIGDRVTDEHGIDTYDGTVVDVIDPTTEPPLLRVYWRLAAGRVGRSAVRDHYANHIRRVT